MTNILYPAASLEDLCWALAEGATEDSESAAGAAVIAWPGQDCPWFMPRPCADGLEVADIRIAEED